MSHLFISHSSKDASITNQLVSYLEANGQKCWIAPRDIPAGRDYTDVINDALEHCSTLIFLLSQHSIDSNWVKKEISVAMSKGKRVLPFKVARCQLSSGYLFMLNNVQIIDATSATASHFPELLEAITGVATTSTPEPKSKKKIIVGITAAVAAIALLAAIMLLTRHGGNEESLPLPTDTAPLTALTADTNETIALMPETKESRIIDSQTSGHKPQNTKKPKEATSAKAQENANDEQAEEAALKPKPEQASLEEEEEAKAKAAKAAKAAKEYERKFNTAISFYMNQDYRNALAIFEELRRANPSDKRLGNYISDCRSKLRKND